MRFLGYLWSLPYGVLGIVPALLFLITFQAKARVKGGKTAPFVVQVHVGGPFGRWMRKKGWGGFTLGWFVFIWDNDSPEPYLVVHEHRHVWQCLWLGVFYPLVYLALLALYGYQKHPLEKDAVLWATTNSD